VVAGNSELGERRVFEGVEAKETTLELVVVNAVDIVFSVTYSNQVLVCHVDIDASDLTALSKSAFENEERYDLDGSFFHFVFLYDYFFLFLFGAFFNGHAHASFLVFIFVVVIEVAALHEIALRIGLVEDMLLMVESLGQKSLDNLNS
jgi:hypothetical protein